MMQSFGVVEKLLLEINSSLRPRFGPVFWHLAKWSWFWKKSILDDSRRSRKDRCGSKVRCLYLLSTVSCREVSQPVALPVPKIMATHTPYSSMRDYSGLPTWRNNPADPMKPWPDDQSLRGETEQNSELISLDISGSAHRKIRNSPVAKVGWKRCVVSTDLVLTSINFEIDK